MSRILIDLQNYGLKIYMVDDILADKNWLVKLGFDFKIIVEVTS
jgi:hypothetical protein